MAKDKRMVSEYPVRGNPRYEPIDPVPMAPAVGYRREPSQAERIRQMIRSEQLRREAEAAGAETFEEADDFEVDDETYDPSTPYEEQFEGQFDPSTGEVLAPAPKGGQPPEPKGQAKPGGVDAPQEPHAPPAPGPIGPGTKAPAPSTDERLARLENLLTALLSPGKS